MKNELSILKGLHPGIILEHELKKRNLSKGRFAISINEFPQTLSAVIMGKRSMNTKLALSIEHALGIEEGFFMTLQVFYDIKEEKQRQEQVAQPDLSILRPILFWDTKIEKINWQNHKKAVIRRVFERGNLQEKQEITRFYGKETIEQVLNNQRLTIQA